MTPKRKKSRAARKRKMRCPACDGRMRYRAMELAVRFMDRSMTIPTLGWWCLKCSEAILTGEPLLTIGRAMAKLREENPGE